jgi:hypothetical protein
MSMLPPKFGFSAYGGGGLPFELPLLPGGGTTPAIVPGTGQLYLAFVDSDQKAYMYKANARWLRGGTFIQKLYVTRHLIELPNRFPVSRLSREDSQTWFKIQGEGDFVHLTLEVAQYAEPRTSRIRFNRSVRILNANGGECYFEILSGFSKVDVASERRSWNLIMGGELEFRRLVATLGIAPIAK